MVVYIFLTRCGFTSFSSLFRTLEIRLSLNIIAMNYLQRYSQSHRPHGFTASTGSIPQLWKNAHKPWWYGFLSFVNSAACLWYKFQTTYCVYFARSVSSELSNRRYSSVRIHQKKYNLFFSRHKNRLIDDRVA